MQSYWYNHLCLNVIFITVISKLSRVVIPSQLNDKIAEFEQEKFEMQKQHTKNIQELLDETNQRLQKMETEYNQQATATVS